MKYFDRYVLREIAAPFGIGLLVYSFGLLMNQLLLFPELYIARGVPLGTTLKLLAYLIPSILAFTVPMSVLMGVLAGLGRLSTDSEITAFKTLGIGHGRILRPLLMFAFAGWLLTSALALSLAPASNFKFVQTMAEAQSNRVDFNFDPRAFNETLPGMTVYFQDRAPGGDWTNVFIYTGPTSMEPRLLLARSGRLDVSSAKRRAFLHLKDVVEHSVILDAASEYTLTSFNSIDEEIGAESLFRNFTASKRVREKTMAELLRGRREAEAKRARQGPIRPDAGPSAPSAASGRRLERALVRSAADDEIRAHDVEIHKKLALPFACWVFVFLGLPLGISTKKGGRTSGFTLSIIIIFLYYLLITAGEKFAMDGRLPPWLGIWGANIVFALLGARLFFFSAREIPLFASWARRRARPEAEEARAPSRPARRRLEPALRFPTILDRYILRKYAGVCGLVFASFIAVSTIVTFFEQIGKIYEHGKPIGLLFSYVWFRIPEFINLGIPVTALTATLLVLGLMTKSNELTAMKACGVSVYRAVAPVVIMAVLLGGLAFYIQERVLPPAALKNEELLNRINDLPDRPDRGISRRWAANARRDRFYHFQLFDVRKEAWRNMSVFDLDSGSWTLRRRFYAAEAVYKDKVLHLRNGWMREFKGTGMEAYATFDDYPLEVPEGRDLFWAENKSPGQMTYAELRKYTHEVKALGLDSRRLSVDLNSKLSFPLVALVMTLLGIPFAFSMGRRGALVGIGVSLALAMVYWVTIGIFRSLGYVGYLSVFLAAWGPALIFGLLGIALSLRLRT